MTTTCVFKLLALKIIDAGNLSSSTAVFPQPMEPAAASVPDWAIAIIVAAAGVTFIWLVAIFALVSFYIAMWMSKSVILSMVFTT